MTSSENSFYGLGIVPAILEVLSDLGFTIPTPIQARSIPQAIEGKDIMGIAQTGTGKTLAFGIPLVQRVIQNRGLGLVIVPTRELAIQVAESINKVGGPLGVRTATLIGGESMSKQLREIHRRPNVVICTPGRMIDHLGQKTLSLGKVGVLVLDEADRMLDMGFAPQLKEILKYVPKERQTMLFSATMPPEIILMARDYMELPVQVEIARSGSAAEKVTQEIFFVPQEDKIRLLEKILYEYKGSVLVFARTKHSAKRICAYIGSLGHPAAELHSNRSLNQRREALEGFRTGKYRVLVATDIAARGIDVVGIELVINFDLPQKAEDYVHRIGRTGRAGEGGHAISFARPNEKRDVGAIEKLLRINLPVSPVFDLPGQPAPKPHPGSAPRRNFKQARRPVGRRRYFRR